MTGSLYFMAFLLSGPQETELQRAPQHLSNMSCPLNPSPSAQQLSLLQGHWWNTGDQGEPHTHRHPRYAVAWASALTHYWWRKSSCASCSSSLHLMALG